MLKNRRGKQAPNHTEKREKINSPMDRRRKESDKTKENRWKKSKQYHTMHKVRTIKYTCGEMKWMALLCALYRTEQIRVCVCVRVLYVYCYCCCFLECWSTIFLSSWSNKPRNVWHKTSNETFQLMLNALAHINSHSQHTHTHTPFTWKKGQCTEMVMRRENCDVS